MYFIGLPTFSILNYEVHVLYCKTMCILIIGFSPFLILLFSVGISQLDLCQKMATYLTRSSAGHIVSFSLSICMDDCCISSSNACHVGKLVNCNIESGYNWSGCNHGWNCSSIGILFNHALVENTMAKFKYVFPYPLCLHCLPRK